MNTPDLCDATLDDADLRSANLRGANLRRAHLHQANFRNADLSEADLSCADLRRANFHETNLCHADLRRATLRSAILVGTKLAGAKFSDCDIYGIAVWGPKGDPDHPHNLKITPEGEPVITVDDLEVAQFIYLLLHNEKIRHVIETVTARAVLILGRFTPERKAVLDAIRKALRTHDRLPIVFDFTVPRTQTSVETVATLAHMARYVIADLTDAKSVLQELQAIVPNSPSVLVQPILLASQEEPGMFDFIQSFKSVLEPYRYHSQEEVLAALDAKIIAPVEERYKR